MSKVKSVKKLNKKLIKINFLLNSISPTNSELKNRINSALEELEKSFSDNLSQIKKLKKFKDIVKKLKKENERVLKELKVLKLELEKTLILKNEKENYLDSLKNNINLFTEIHSGKDAL